MLDTKIDTVAKLLQGSPKPKKARRMSRMIVGPISGHRLLEIADPIDDKNEQEVTELDFNLIRVDMGPATIEGGIYHAKFSIDRSSIKKGQAWSTKDFGATKASKYFDFIQSILQTNDQSTGQIENVPIKGLDPSKLSKLKEINLSL